MSKRIDLNADVGEGFASDEALMEYITSANIACGVHAGDEQTMRLTARLAMRHGVALGAHPSLDDRANFGRLERPVTPDDVRVLVTKQVRTLQRLAATEGGALRHLKPHGALYHMAAHDPALARAVAEAIYALDRGLILFGLSGSASIREARTLGLAVAEEAFVDRGYNRDGTLVNRSAPGAAIVCSETAAGRAVKMVQEHTVVTVDGTTIPLIADTLCIHGDAPHAAALARTLRQELEKAGHVVVKVGTA